MSKGAHYPSEARECRDTESGRRIRQVTSHPSIHHHPFFFVSAYDRAMTKLIFVSHRTGSPQIYIMNADGSGQKRLITPPPVANPVSKGVE